MRLLPAVLLAAAVFFSLPIDASADEVKKEAGEHRARASDLDGGRVDTTDIEAEIIFGRDVAARLLGRYGLVRDDPLTRYVNLVGKAVAAHGSRPELEYRFGVMDTSEVNAFAAPGGYVFVTRGAIDLMEDEAELAGVLAHEISHINERHIVKELGIRGVDASGSDVIVSIVGGLTDTMRVATYQLVDKAMEILFERGYKRQDEIEADRVGTILLYLSGYEPTALQRYIGRIPNEPSENTRVITGTHPPGPERLDKLSAFVRENGLPSEGGIIGKERFRKHARNRQ